MRVKVLAAHNLVNTDGSRVSERQWVLSKLGRHLTPLNSLRRRYDAVKLGPRYNSVKTREAKTIVIVLWKTLFAVITLLVEPRLTPRLKFKFP